LQSQFQPQFIRRISSWGLGGALVLLAVFGIYQAKALQDGLTEHELRLTEDHLDRLVIDLEEYASLQALLWLGELGEKNSLEAIDEKEETLRLTEPAFDSYYVWNPQAPDRFLFPFPARSPQEAHHRATLCLNRGADFSRPMSPAVSAMNLRACMEEEPTLKLQASLQAGETHLLGGRPHDALRGLEEAGLALNAPLNPERSEFLAVDIAEGRVQAARAMLAMDDTQAAEQQMMSLFKDIQLQSGATLGYLFAHLNDRVVPAIQQWNRPLLLDSAQALQRHTQRRLAGFSALQLHRRSPAPNLGEDPKLIYASPGEAPFLIAFARVGENGLHGAVQFNQHALLKKMLLEAGPEASHLVVRDAKGVGLAGATMDQGILAEVPFQSFLPHLRLGTSRLFELQRTPAYRTHFIWQILPILFAGLLGIVAVFVRYTADKKERELRTRQQEFATRVTHELKTPLAGIRLMAENLEMGAVNDPKTAQEFAGRIVDESDRLTQRVNEILQAAREPSGTERVDIDLQDLLLDLVEEWEPRFDDAGLILHTELGRCSIVRADRTALRDAVANLLDNALKYRREDIPAPQATLRLFEEAKQAVIEVEDNGLGVPAEKRKSIFERYSRVEGPGRGKTGGHGLGLAFAREAILAHKGRIECHEGLEGGACLTVRIPVA
jgi:signal transduction histidine kinase